MPISVDTGHQLSGLRDECKRLEKHLEMLKTRDTHLMQAKRDATESEEAVVVCRGRRRRLTSRRSDLIFRP